MASRYPGHSVTGMWATRVPQLFTPSGQAYQDQSARDDGWLTGAATGILLRAEPGNQLAIRPADQPETLRLLPE